MPSAAARAWRSTPLRLFLLAASAALLAGDASEATGVASAAREVLESGVEVITIPQSGVPLAAVVSIVRSGSSAEAPEISGVSHMLEHLLFNGTETRSQEALYADLDGRGIVHNAHTGLDEMTLFMLGPRDQVPAMIEIQSEMLFRSVFPPGKIEKERGIVLNEIARDRTQDATLIEDFIAEVMYRDTPCALQGTGTEQTVRGLTRDEILAYHRRHYGGGNVTLILMGDLDPGSALAQAGAAFGRAPASLPAGASSVPCLPAPGAAGKAYSRRLEIASRRVVLAAAAPAPSSREYAAAEALASMIEPALAESASRRLGEAGGNLLDASVSVAPQRSGSMIRVMASLDGSLPYETGARALWEELASRLGAPPDAEALRNFKVSERVRLALLEEKPHYFGLDRAPLVACCGWQGVVDAPSRVAAVSVSDVASLAVGYARVDAWAVLMTGKDAPVGPPAASFLPREAQAEGGASPGVAAPPGAGIREVLPNGLTVLVRSSPESSIFAASLVARDRCASEPAGKEGVADLLHRLAGHATRLRDAATLKRDLRRLGATLKVTDDPDIPYDDADTTAEYSFIRLETLDEFAGEALALLAEMVREPSFDAAAIEKARGLQIERVRQAAARPSERARVMFLSLLLGEGASMARSPFGSESALLSINAEDLAAFRDAYFDPSNLILSLVTSLPPRQVLESVARSLGTLPSTRRSRPTAAALLLRPAATAREKSGAGQAYILEGAILRPRAEDVPRLAAAASVLSRRMGLGLREKRGLSYSLGASVDPLGDGLLLAIRMGTKPDQVEEALRGIEEVLSSLRTSPPGAEEIAAAVRSEGVRILMRRLSRITRAQSAAVEEIRSGSPVPAPWRDLPAADPAGVAAAARAYLGGSSLSKVVLE